MKRLAIIMFFLLCISALPARTYIVCVGIADYPGRQNDLRVSANDAKTISGIFTKNGMFFLSSRSTEKSLETPRQTGFKNSLFTVFLERGLRGGADTNKDRVITAKEIYNFVHQGVVEASGNRQHPVMWGKFDGNMVVMKW